MSDKTKERVRLIVAIVAGMVAWGATRDALVGPLEGWQAWLVGAVAGLAVAMAVTWGLGRLLGVKSPVK